MKKYILIIWLLVGFVIQAKADVSMQQTTEMDDFEGSFGGSVVYQFPDKNRRGRDSGGSWPPNERGPGGKRAPIENVEITNVEGHLDFFNLVTHVSFSGHLIITTSDGHVIDNYYSNLDLALEAKKHLEQGASIDISKCYSEIASSSGSNSTGGSNTVCYYDFNKCSKGQKTPIIDTNEVLLSFQIVDDRTRPFAVNHVTSMGGSARPLN